MWAQGALSWVPAGAARQGDPCAVPCRGAEGCALHSTGGKSPRSTPITVPRKKRGFCECCQETFEELQKVKVPLGPDSLQELWGALRGFVNHGMPISTVNSFGRNCCIQQELPLRWERGVSVCPHQQVRAQGVRRLEHDTLIP